MLMRRQRSQNAAAWLLPPSVAPGAAAPPKRAKGLVPAEPEDLSCCGSGACRAEGLASLHALGETLPSHLRVSGWRTIPSEQSVAPGRTGAKLTEEHRSSRPQGTMHLVCKLSTSVPVDGHCAGAAQVTAGTQRLGGTQKTFR